MKPLLTCCLKVIFSSEDFFIKLDKNDNGKTKAALPSKISPISIELTATDNPGLREMTEAPDKGYLLTDNKSKERKINTVRENANISPTLLQHTYH